MATYVNDLRLKEITTGDESGTWGTSTNTNLELIAEAFSYGTEDQLIFLKAQVQMSPFQMAIPKSFIQTEQEQEQLFLMLLLV
jgi:hypothetical protein